MPHQILSEFGTTTPAVVSALAGANYFHGTRVSDSSSFIEEGVLSLCDALDGIWRSLWGLAKAHLSRDRWLQFRKNLESGCIDDHSAFLYRLKVGDAQVGGGPFALLVRSVHLDPRDSERDFLGNPPEIVEGILLALEEDCAVSLRAEYLASTQPCLVKFRSDVVGAVEVESAMWYLYDRSRNRALGRWSAEGGFSGNGARVPAADIVAVEFIDLKRTPPGS